MYDGTANIATVLNASSSTRLLSQDPSPVALAGGVEEGALAPPLPLHKPPG